MSLVTMRCLIVDDHQSFLEAATTLLERGGFEVVGVASSSAEALLRVEAVRPDVILVDVFLGEESGLELARRLAGDGRPNQAAVVLISSYAEADLADLIVRSPAIGFVTKADLSAAAVRRVVDASERRDT